MAAIDKAFNINDLQAIAKKRLPPGLYDFIERGAEDEITMQENEAAIKRVFLRQRVGNDVSACDTSTTVFGVKQTMPMAIGVTGLSGMIAYKGEFKLARAAAAAGVPYTLGSTNFARVSEIKEICGDLLWRQLYPLQDWVMDHQVQVAKDAGVRVLVITMDSAVNGNREYMLRNGFAPGMTNARTYREILTSPHWLFGTLLAYFANGGLPEIEDMPEGHRVFFQSRRSWTASSVSSITDFTWDKVRALRRNWQDVLVVKGLSTPEDARIAAECGVDGIIVSNHGGRSLDGCVPTFSVLPAIVDAVAPRVTVMTDGSYKRGADMVKAIAAGAASVMVGRSTLFGLAAGGEAGVAKALSIFNQEIRRTLALVGCKNLSELNRELLQF